MDSMLLIHEDVLTLQCHHSSLCTWIEEDKKDSDLSYHTEIHKQVHRQQHIPFHVVLSGKKKKEM